MTDTDSGRAAPALPLAPRRRLLRWMSPRYTFLRFIGLTPSEEFLDRLEPENARLLAQFFTDLEVRHGLARAAGGDTDDGRIREIFNLRDRSPDAMTWRDACEAEMRIALLTRGEGPRGDLARRRAEPKRIAPGGLGIAAASGLMGAIFFMLVSQRDATAEPSLEDLRTRFGNPMVFLRLGAGIVSATILYFVFGAEVLGDRFFPKPAEIGLVGIGPPADDGKPLVCGDAMPLGRCVPNIELALLVTCSFLGGYAERFVTGVLDSVQAARREPKAQPEPTKS